MCVFDLLLKMVSCRAPVLQLGVLLVLCILLVLMVVGLFVFESLSVSWSCRAGCTSAVGCRLKGSFHSWGEMREQAATRAASTAFDPAHNHTTPHLQPIQILVFVFQIHQCLTQIFEKQPPAHPWIQILTKILLKIIDFLLRGNHEWAWTLSWPLHLFK